ncbi:MAG: universal stress protein [Chloroflexi bacterium]|nr:universal stress protein [Chloroflexota bacterium]
MRILLAVDGSPSADRARDLVAGLPWPAGTLVRVVAALDSGPALWGGPWLPAIPADADLLEEVAIRELADVLARSREGLAAAGLAVETELLRGSPRLAIPEEARAWRPDLTVLGSRGHGPIEAAVLGSVSSAVVDHSAGPVLVARGDTVTRVVLAEDGSEAAKAACDLLERWPAFASVPIRVVGVVDVAAPWRSGIAPTMFGAAMEIYAELLASTRTTVEQLVATTVGRLRTAGHEVEGEVREGDPAGEIVRAVGELAGDLVIIGSRGQVGLSRIVLGSVASSVLRHAHCSVLVVRRPPDEG